MENVIISLSKHRLKRFYEFSSQNKDGFDAAVFWCQRSQTIQFQHTFETWSVTHTQLPKDLFTLVEKPSF